MSEFPANISVLLADDHDMVRQGVAALINREPGLNVVAQCGNGREALEQLEAVSPDVVVSDLAMPEMDGLQLCTMLRQRKINTPVIILTIHYEPQLVERALSCGATAYLTKASAFQHLLDAIRAVTGGGTYLGPGVTRSNDAAGKVDPYDSLTPRERQILAMIGRGLSTRAIALELEISSKTVGTHRVRIMRKLNIHHQVALARYAIERAAAAGGLILPAKSF